MLRPLRAQPPESACSQHKRCTAFRCAEHVVALCPEGLPVNRLAEDPSSLVLRADSEESADLWYRSLQHAQQAVLDAAAHGASVLPDWEDTSSSMSTTSGELGGGGHGRRGGGAARPWAATAAACWGSTSGRCCHHSAEVCNAADLEDTAASLAAATEQAAGEPQQAPRTLFQVGWLLQDPCLPENGGAPAPTLDQAWGPLSSTPYNLCAGGRPARGAGNLWQRPLPAALVAPRGACAAAPAGSPRRGQALAAACSPFPAQLTCPPRTVQDEEHAMAVDEQATSAIAPSPAVVNVDAEVALIVVRAGAPAGPAAHRQHLFQGTERGKPHQACANCWGAFRCFSCCPQLAARAASSTAPLAWWCTPRWGAWR